MPIFRDVIKGQKSVNHSVAGRLECGFVGCSFEQREGPGRVERVREDSADETHQGWREEAFGLENGCECPSAGQKALVPNDC